MILFGTFTLLHLIGIVFLHFLPGLCGAALFVFKGYAGALSDRGIGGTIRAGCMLLVAVCTGLGGLLAALLLPEWPGKRTYTRDQLGEGW